MIKKSIHDGIEILPLLVFMALTKFLPLNTKATIGGWLISWILRTNYKLKKRVIDNLDLTMPNISEYQKKQFICQFGKFIGMTFTELIFNSEFQRNQSKFQYSLIDLEPLMRAKKNGRPIIIVSAHLGPWEAVRAVLKMHNLVTGAIYKKNKNQFYEFLHLKAIKVGGEPIFSTGLSGTRDMINHLKKGGIVAVMLDQAANDGEFFDFLGSPAKTTTSIAKIALKLNALVVPSYAIRSDGSKHINIYFEKPISNTTYQDMTSRLTKSIEARVVQNPEQWYWLHKRWKY
ncbi:MAG: lysophospholipid acyltransferase family protein [Paracoccaceae bacterium]|nr:lysophospholipid acyltransferase family protein [Paracoccaceae bacterium]